MVNHKLKWCENNGINYYQFGYWKKRLKQMGTICRLLRKNQS
ncbi:IS66 family insertion sequence element accessory protein TnpA [Niallia sp. JL1B1071]